MKPLLLVMLPIVLLVAFVGCKDERGVDRYTAAGKIVALPAGEAKAVDIHHERIPTYRTRDGKQKGMDAMQMSFTPVGGVSLDGLAVGDPVRFSFEVHWDTAPYLRLTAIEKLPPDTTLEL